MSNGRPRTRPSATIAADLRRRIGAGEWEPGQQLPSVAALAEHYGHARRTISRAVKILETEGLVEIDQGWGTFRAGGERG
jgi:DNA-binding GntR family transcriptional regulator